MEWNGLQRWYALRARHEVFDVATAAGGHATLFRRRAPARPGVRDCPSRSCACMRRSRRSSIRRASSIPGACTRISRTMYARPSSALENTARGREAAAAAPRLRALRVLPAGLPDLPHPRQRARQPARPHLPGEAAARGRAHGRGPRATTSIAASPVAPARPLAHPASSTDGSSSSAASLSRRARARSPRGSARRDRGLVERVRGHVGSACAGAGQAVRGLHPECARMPVAMPDSPAPAARHARRVVLLEGCVQPGLAPGINAAAARVLDQLGIAVRARGEACCGALTHHLGGTDGPRPGRAQRRSLRAPLDAGAECVVSTASACGLMVRDYGRLLAGDGVRGARAPGR